MCMVPVWPLLLLLMGWSSCWPSCTVLVLAVAFSKCPNAWSPCGHCPQLPLVPVLASDLFDVSWSSCSQVFAGFRQCRLHLITGPRVDQRHLLAALFSMVLVLAFALEELSKFRLPELAVFNISIRSSIYRGRPFRQSSSVTSSSTGSTSFLSTSSPNEVALLVLSIAW